MRVPEVGEHSDGGAGVSGHSDGGAGLSGHSDGCI